MIDESTYLQTAVDISHLGARVQDEGVLLEAVADRLQRGLGLAAVHIYIVDASGKMGELRYFAGAGDRKAILKVPAVPVGSNSEVGEVLSGDVGREIGDLSAMPEGIVPPGVTRGVALPFVIEGQPLGAMVVYEEQATDPPNISQYAALADMVALSIETVRMRSVGMPDTLRATKEGSQKPSHISLGDGDLTEVDASHTARINMGGAVVGAMSFGERGERVLDEDEVELIDSVADQVGQALEHLSLLEEAQSAALRERLINEITAQLQHATTVDELLRTAARAVRTALGNVEVTARLAPTSIGAGELDEGK